MHDGGAVVASAVVLLTDRREQEHLVVHRETEDDGEEHHRGPGLDRRAAVDTEDAAEPSPLEDHDHDAVGRADRQQVHHDGLERHEHAAEDDQQQHEAQQQHAADEPRQPAREDRREVDAHRGLPADVHVVGKVAAQVVHEVLGCCGLRRRRREGSEHRDPAVGALGCRLDERDARCARDLLHDRRHGRSSGVGRGVDDDHERTVDAGAEAVGEPVVGVAGRGADGVVAGVGHGEPHAESRQREGDEHAASDHREADRATAHGRTPARAHGRLVRAPATADVQLVDAGADEREQRREQRDRRGDCDRDGGRSAPREPGEEAEPHEQQAEQRDHHGDSCEDDRTAGGAHRFVDRVEHARTSRERSPVARDDEQRVVDADADADHRGDLAGEVRSVDECRPEGDCRERDEDAGDRGCDRQSHRDHGAERQQQDHDRSEEADDLGCR